jgi:hypothetical protein
VRGGHRLSWSGCGLQLRRSLRREGDYFAAFCARRKMRECNSALPLPKTLLGERHENVRI